MTSHAMPPQLFISYRRKSWGFTHRLDEKLREKLDADIFIDYTGVADADFERSILGALRRSQAMLLVITEETFSDRIHNDVDWVRREIREALTLDLPIVLVCVEGKLPPSGLPDDIKDIARKQGINFYPEYFTAAVDNLTQFVVKLGVAGLRTVPLPSAPLPAPSVPSDSLPAPTPMPEKPISGMAALEEALDLLENGDPAKAKFLLEQLQLSGFRRINVAEFIEQADAAIAEIERRRTAQVDYDEISVLFKRRLTEKQAIAEFRKWQADYPDLWEALDVQNFRTRIAPLPPPPPVIKRKTSLELLPAPFAWIDIPAGKVTLVEGYFDGSYIKKGQKQTFDVPAFQIAKYPLTNAQFRLFVEADGYAKPEWWTDEGWAKRKTEGWTEPRFWQETTLNQDNYPVVGMSWFEVVAYGLWLSEATGEAISLPTEQQWQWAAQGDTNWAYPYGDKLDISKCNFNSNSTTPVTQYEGKGDSPFKVVDMSGNVFEWCALATGQ
jgi:hypothetical protein